MFRPITLFIIFIINIIVFFTVFTVSGEFSFNKISHFCHYIFSQLNRVLSNRLPLFLCQKSMIIVLTNLFSSTYITGIKFLINIPYLFIIASIGITRLIADVCFKGGLIDAWGRGTVSIIDECKAAGLPEPELAERYGGFMVTLFKNNLTEEQLVKLGLNQRQIKAVQYVKEKGRITNAEYQEINKVSRQMATNELHNLANEFNLLINKGYGAGSYFEFVN